MDAFLGNFCDQFAQQYQQQQQQQQMIGIHQQQVVPSCGTLPQNIGLSHHNQNIMKATSQSLIDPFRSACRTVTTASMWESPSGSLGMRSLRPSGGSSEEILPGNYAGCVDYRVNGSNSIGLLQTATPNSVASPGVITARENFGLLACQTTSPSLVHALSQAAQSRRQRSEKKQVPDDLKDDKYYERRKRNNVAAKKSRDSRKAREDEISIRASFLEKENAILRAQVATLRDEASSLRQLLLQKQVPTTSAGQQNALGGPRPAATSTPNAKQAFSLAQQPQGSLGGQQHGQSLAATIAQQAAAAYAAFASSNMSNMHHHNQNQPQQQQEIINSAA